MLGTVAGENNGAHGWLSFQRPAQIERMWVFVRYSGEFGWKKNGQRFWPPTKLKFLSHEFSATCLSIPLKIHVSMYATRSNVCSLCTRRFADLKVPTNDSFDSWILHKYRCPIQANPQTRQVNSAIQLVNYILLLQHPIIDYFNMSLV